MQREGVIASQLDRVPRSGIREFFELVQGMPEVISLGVGEPDFVTPWHIREAAIYALDKGRTSYTSNWGLKELRRVISRYLGAIFGLEYSPENQILVTVGVSEAMDLALRCLINPGDEVLIHEPSYVSYVPSVILAHGKPVAIPCGGDRGFTLDAQSLSRSLSPRSKVLVLNFPTNPTGATLQGAEAEAIAAVVRKHNLIVITDEIYGELTYEGTHVSIASLPGMADRTVFLHGVSKAFAMTGFRIGYACGPVEVIEAMLRVHQYSMLCASSISQEAAIEALRNGERDAREMRDQYRVRRDFMVRSLRASGLSCHMPAGTFYAFPCVGQTHLSSKEFAVQLLKTQRIACVPGNVFGASGEGYVRCCFATSLDRLEVAAERISRFMRTVGVLKREDGGGDHPGENRGVNRRILAG